MVVGVLVVVVGGVAVEAAEVVAAVEDGNIIDEELDCVKKVMFVLSCNIVFLCILALKTFLCFCPFIFFLLPMVIIALL